MKPMKNAEDFVRRGKARVATDPQMDKHVLDDSFAAMEETVAGRASVVGMILRRRAAKLAAAAVIIIAVGLLITQSNPPEPAHAPGREVARSPAKMMSMMSLRTAYRRRGLDGLDRQFGDSLGVLGPHSSTMSMQELLESFNGY